MQEAQVCSSSHSRLVGFVSTIPGLLRLFQCLRRFYDTRNVFPHLVNAGKYSATILAYMMLSMWRISNTPVNRALYIVFATINTLYCCTSLHAKLMKAWWDLFMDWSLMQPHAKHPFLRSDLGYKRIWVLLPKPKTDKSHIMLL
jgi:xenotropic and polytropic retrovirus receptor 1